MENHTLLESVEARTQAKIDSSNGKLSLKDIETAWRTSATEMGCEMTVAVIAHGKRYADSVHRKLYLEKHITV